MNAAQVIKALTEAEVQFKQLVSGTMMKICLVASFGLVVDIRLFVIANVCNGMCCIMCSLR